MSRPEHVVFLFLDGVGLGADDAAMNPLADVRWRGLAALAGGVPMTASAPTIDSHHQCFTALDATLGVEGLPQSGTGQAALFTGLNAARIAGQHFGPYPPTATHAPIAAANIFRQLQQRLQVPIDRFAFANAYPPQFFQHAGARGRWTVTTRCCREAGVPIRTLEDLRIGQALAADLTNRGLRDRLGVSVDLIDEDEAARRLAAISQSHHFTLFEYYLTDKAGHSQDPIQAEVILTSIDRFIQSLLAELDLKRTLIVMTSDHGNLEDLSTRSHTRHPVPLAARGVGAGQLTRASSLVDVVPALLDLLDPA